MELKETVQAITIGVVSFLAGVYVSKNVLFASKSSDKSSGKESELQRELNKATGEVRMALVVRGDIGMLKGKAAAQCAHAAVGLYRSMSDVTSENYNGVLLSRWLRGGQAKITLKSPDLENMEELMAIAMSLGINTEVICDAGRTQVDPGTITVLGLGPCPKSVLDSVTGELKLY